MGKRPCKYTVEDLREPISEHLFRQGSATTHGLAKALGIPNHQTKGFQKVLEALQLEGTTFRGMNRWTSQSGKLCLREEWMLEQ